MGERSTRKIGGRRSSTVKSEGREGVGFHEKKREFLGICGQDVWDGC